AGHAPHRIEDQRAHWLARAATCAWRAIKAAWNPAPKPLSMFTTETLAAQELSIASSAAMPPSDAPYPTLVGTAMTGLATRPPTTDGSAPSMPAQTTMASASRNDGAWRRSRWR